MNELYSALYRKLDANNPFMFTICKIFAGDNYNVIPEWFVAEGTLRVTNDKSRDELLEFMNDTIKISAKKWDAYSNLEYRLGAPPVINDFKKTEQLKNFVVEILEKNQIIFG